jgi:hypothetical protein
LKVTLCIHRENERKSTKKFCIDIGTQTHGWSFPDFLPGSDTSPPTALAGRHFHARHRPANGGPKSANHGAVSTPVAETEPNSSSTTTSTNNSKSCDDESDLDGEKLADDAGRV